MDNERENSGQQRWEGSKKKNPKVIELERRIQVKHNGVRELADCGNADTAAIWETRRAAGGPQREPVRWHKWR